MHYQTETKMEMNWLHSEETCHQYHQPVPCVEPSGDKEERQTEEVMEENHTAGA